MTWTARRQCWWSTTVWRRVITCVLCDNVLVSIPCQHFRLDERQTITVLNLSSCKQGDHKCQLIEICRRHRNEFFVQILDEGRLRDNVVVHTGKMGSLKRFRDDVGEVKQGFECGIGLARFNDLKESDVIECFVVEKIAAQSL